MFAGWGLDALDVQMFTLAIPAIIVAFGIDKTQAGLISGVTLVSSALGGWIAGAISDRFGRMRTLQFTILWFSVFTFLCAFAQTFPPMGRDCCVRGRASYRFIDVWLRGI